MCQRGRNSKSTRKVLYHHYLWRKLYGHPVARDDDPDNPEFLHSKSCLYCTVRSETNTRIVVAVWALVLASCPAFGSGVPGSSRRDSLRVSAHDYMRHERPEDAAFALAVMAREGLAGPRDYVWLGEALVYAGQMEAANDAYRKAIKLGREAQGLNGLGLIHLNTPTQRMRALDYFQRALRADAGLVDARYNLAKAYLYLRPGEAEKTFRSVLEMEPDHEDALYQIGLIHEREGDPNSARRAYLSQLETSPGHAGAAYRLARLMLDGEDRDEAIAVLEELAAAGSEMENDAYLELARVRLEADDVAKAQEFFERYIDGLPHREQKLYTSFELVSTRQSHNRYRDAMAYERVELERRFWVFQDPAPLTPENERLLEHYRRVAYAREHFSEGDFPWDDRGDVYIRMGRADHVSRSSDVRGEMDPLVQNARINFANRTYLNLAVTPGLPTFPTAENDKWEYWVYVGIERGIEITFTSKYFDGRYVFAPIPTALTGRAATDLLALHGDMVVKNLSARQPSIYEPGFAGLPIDFYYYPADFRGSGVRTRLEIYYGLPASEVSKLQTPESGDLVVLDRGLVLFDESWREVHRVMDQISFRTPSSDEVHRGAFLPGVIPVDLPPGTYQMALQIRDAVTGRTQVYRDELRLDNYRRGSDLQVSDIELAFSIVDVDTAGQAAADDLFVKSGLKVIPMSSRSFRRDQHAFLYFEIYNLTKDEFGQATYSVDYRIRSFEPRSLPVKILRGLGRILRLVDRGQEIEISYEQSTSKTEEVAYVELDLTASEPGGQKVTVTVTDSLSGQSMSKEIEFEIAPY